MALIGPRALRGAREAGGAGVRALLTRQRRRRALSTVGASCARLTRQLALLILEGARGAFDASAHAPGRCKRASSTRRLLCAAGWRVVALISQRALCGAREAGGAGVGAFIARQRRRRALGTVRA